MWLPFDVMSDKLHSQSWVLTCLLHREISRQTLPWQFWNFTCEFKTLKFRAKIKEYLVTHDIINKEIKCCRCLFLTVIWRDRHQTFKTTILMKGVNGLWFSENNFAGLLNACMVQFIPIQHVFLGMLWKWEDFFVLYQLFLLFISFFLRYIFYF